MARVSIYVPDDLKARMDEAGELNWSAAAQRAFEIEINSQRWKMETDVTEKAAARLRVSKEKGDEALGVAGKAAGRKWALDAAEYHDLKRLAEHNWSDIDYDQHADDLAHMIAGEVGEFNQSFLWETWKEWYGNLVGDTPEPAWLDGFVEGAAEVWEEVADKI